jgi:hypothetical protein
VDFVNQGHNAIVVTVLLNPTAVRASELKAEIAELFLASGSEARIVELQRGQDPAEVARAASARTSIVVAAGGDGTVSRVAAGLVGTPAVLGVLPIGTLNHFAKDLGLPFDLQKAVAAIAAPRVGSVDVGQVNDRVFVNNSSIGVYPNIVEPGGAAGDGHVKWPAFAQRRYNTAPRDRRASGSGPTVTACWRTPFVFVGNNEQARQRSAWRQDQGFTPTGCSPVLRPDAELPMRSPP